MPVPETGSTATAEEDRPLLREDTADRHRVQQAGIPAARGRDAARSMQEIRIPAEQMPEDAPAAVRDLCRESLRGCLQNTAAKAAVWV